MSAMASLMEGITGIVNENATMKENMDFLCDVLEDEILKSDMDAHFG